MQKKSKVFTVLIIAMMHLMEPAFRVLMQKMLYGINPVEFFIGVFNMEYSAFTPFAIFLFPLAGIALLSFRKIGYFAFMLVHITMLIFNITVVFDVMKEGLYPQVMISLVLILANLVMLSFMLKKSLRVFYFNNNSRWWEQRIRFDMEESVKVFDMNDREVPVIEGLLKNISIKGARLESTEEIKRDSEIVIQFNCKDRDFDLRAIVVNQFEFQIGVEFINMDKDTQRNLGNIIKAFKLLNMPRSRKNLSINDTLNVWFEGLKDKGKLLAQ